MTSSRPLVSLACTGLLLAFFLAPPPSLRAEEAPRVLFLSSYHPDFPSFFPQIEGFQSVFTERPIVFDIEFMDSKRFPEGANLDNFRRSLEHKLTRLPPYDVVVTADDNALTFALAHQQTLFPGLPMVFLGVNDVDLALAQNANPLVTGVVEAFSMLETLELMVRLHPRTDRIVALVDGTPSGQGVLKTFYRQRQEIAPVILDDLSLAHFTFGEFADRLRQLGDTDVVLLLSAYRDATGKPQSLEQALNLATENFSGPVYHLLDTAIGHGSMGGKVVRHFDQGRAAAEMVTEILAGRPVADIPVETTSPNRYMFDDRQLRRFGIAESDLPRKSIVLYRPWSQYREHKGVIWTTVGVFCGYSLLLAGMGINIRRRKRSEKALAESEVRFRTVVEQAADAMFLHDLQGRFLDVNQQAATSLGYSREELLTLAVPDIDKGLSPEELQKLWGRLQPGQPVTAQGRQRRKDGSTFPVEVHLGRLEIGERPAILAMVRDTTERRRAEKALCKALGEAEDARDRIDAILRSVSDGLVFIDMENRIALINEAAELMLGRQPGEVLSQPFPSALPDAGLQQGLAAIHSGASKETTAEFTLPGNRTIHARSSLVNGADGRKAGIITLLRDVSEERELDRIKSEFISTAAHELRTPLTSIMGFSELLLNEKGIDPAEVADYLGIIHAKTEVLQRIIDDLLDLSRIEAGRKVPVHKGPCDLGELLTELTERYRMENPEFTFETRLEKGPTVATVDGGKIEQVMENLLSNAVKFSEEGTRILVSCEEGDEAFRISVSDEGIGMTPVQTAKIFDRFYRVDSSNTAKEGLGLGMAIARNIVEAHGGKIDVKSRPGEGTTIAFTLPKGVA